MKAMVVDDEKDIELLFRQYFRKEILQKKIELIFAFSGEDALQQLHAMKQPPDVMVILSDINMPGMNGLELLQTVKKNFPDIFKIGQLPRTIGASFMSEMDMVCWNSMARPGV